MPGFSVREARDGDIDGMARLSDLPGSLYARYPLV